MKKHAWCISPRKISINLQSNIHGVSFIRYNAVEDLVQNSSNIFSVFQNRGNRFIILYSADDRPFALSAGIAVGLFDTSTLNFIRPHGYPYTCKHNLGQAEKETSLRRAVLAHASKTHTHNGRKQGVRVREA
jgi:hypothetical protein